MLKLNVIFNINTFLQKKSHWVKIALLREESCIGVHTQMLLLHSEMM